MILLDGKKTSEKISQKLKEQIKVFGEKVKLSVILIGDNPASITYVNKKKEKCLEMEIDCEVIQLDNDVSQQELLGIIEGLNKNNNVTGILIQLPLPSHINTRLVLDKVDVKKDVDGLNSFHLMKILLNDEKVVPCTPKGIMRLLEEYGVGLEGKNVCIIGFSDVVGKPLATMCLNREATVTVCHIKTKNLKQHTLAADVIMVATGVPNLIKADMIKQDVIVIDIGINKVNNKIVGDVDFDNVKNKCSYITPVPGGVGPMTVVSVVENLIKLRRD